MRSDKRTGRNPQRPCRVPACHRERRPGATWYCRPHAAERFGCRYCGSLNLHPSVTQWQRRKASNRNRYCADLACVLAHELDRGVVWVEITEHAGVVHVVTVREVLAAILHVLVSAVPSRGGTT